MALESVRGIGSAAAPRGPAAANELANDLFRSVLEKEVRGATPSREAIDGAVRKLDDENNVWLQEFRARHDMQMALFHEMPLEQAAGRAARDPAPDDQAAERPDAPDVSARPGKL